MIHHNAWTASVGRFLSRTGKATVAFLDLDLTETKWGHRVLDQIFREGKFKVDPDSKSKPDGSRHA
ncbi:hypothetical protein G0Q06_12665 [Puniceicoccales bacterium CK1056]|uniref:Uncharacterized protein n=1 Tax=Oceanipulchritudo coccoides TaxID=2706888 RepID=A0A6B2M6L5_9BACT|nr:hypothetical protein [Oceanipulchritudo coccoides]NDV63310.1 hypothetical protein [Oceanipulchritudo coccoides]